MTASIVRFTINYEDRPPVHVDVRSDSDPSGWVASVAGKSILVDFDGNDVPTLTLPTGTVSGEQTVPLRMRLEESVQERLEIMDIKVEVVWNSVD